MDYFENNRQNLSSHLKLAIVENIPGYDQAIYLFTRLDFNILGTFYSGNLPFGNDRCSNCKRDCKVFLENGCTACEK